ncbi:unnamed protein product [Paramecium pentaurelia]|uniref:Uncharacterized protein n=1 Tax=Paramecium pentaurelia TaxID=43138 RepID=A0A8S1SNK6_9CILI|nr:unnamed protein product [Paramecium pentaurelia]
MSKITNLSSQTSSQIESSSQNFQSQNNQRIIQEEFSQMETQIKNGEGNNYIQQYSSNGGNIDKNINDQRKRELESIKFDCSNEQNHQSKRSDGNIQSMRQDDQMEEDNTYEGEMQTQSQSQQHAQTSSSSQQTSYQTQTIVTKTITTSHRIQQSEDQGQFDAAEYEMMNGQGNVEGEVYESASAQYKYGGYNLQADHAKLGGGLMLNKYNFSDASLKEKQFNSSAGKVQMACEAAMVAALRRQEEAAAIGGGMASWELQMKAMAELKAQYQLSAKITVKQRSFLMYGYGFKGKDGKPQKCDDEDLSKKKCDDEDLNKLKCDDEEINKNKCDDVEQEKPKQGLNFAVCEAECIEKPKKKKPEDLTNAPQDPEEFSKKKKPEEPEEKPCDPEEFSKKKKPNGPEEKPCDPEEFSKKKKPASEQKICSPEDLSKSKNTPRIQSPDRYFQPRSEDFIRLMPKSPQQIVYPVSSVRSIIMPKFVACEPVQVAKQPMLTQCLSVRQPLVIQEEPASFVAVQPVQQQLRTVQPQFVQQQAIIQPVIQQQQVVQVQEMQPLQQVMMVQPTQKIETYSQQHIQVQQPHFISQNVQLKGQQPQYATTQTVQMMTQQPNLVVAQPQQVASVAQPVVLMQGIQQEMFSSVAVQQQIVTNTQLIQQDALSPIRQQQIIQQPQVVLQPSQQQQTMFIQTQPILQQNVQMQQSVLQIQPQQTIQQVQQIPQVTSPLRQQSLVLQPQLQYNTQPLELLQRSQSPVGQQQFKFQTVLHKG